MGALRIKAKAEALADTSLLLIDTPGSREEAQLYILPSDAKVGHPDARLVELDAAGYHQLRRWLSDDPLRIGEGRPSWWQRVKNAWRSEWNRGRASGVRALGVHEHEGWIRHSHPPAPPTPPPSPRPERERR